MMKIQFAVLFLLAAAFSSFGQSRSDTFIQSLVGEWVSTEFKNYSMVIKHDNNVLLVKQTVMEDSGNPLISEYKIYLDGSLQKDGLKDSSVSEARTIVKDSNLTTTFYRLNNGKTKEAFKERFSVKNGNLILRAQMKLGVPFLAGETKQVFQKASKTK